MRLVGGGLGEARRLFWLSATQEHRYCASDEDSGVHGKALFRAERGTLRRSGLGSGQPYGDERTVGVVGRHSVTTKPAHRRVTHEADDLHKASERPARP